MALSHEQLLHMLATTLAAHNLEMPARQATRLHDQIVANRTIWTHVLHERLTALEHEATDAKATRLIALAKRVILLGSPDSTGYDPVESERQFVELCYELQGLREPNISKADQFRRMRGSLSAFLVHHNLGVGQPHVIVAGAALYFHGLRDSFEDLDVVIPGLAFPIIETHAGLTIDASETLLDDGALTKRALTTSLHVPEVGLSFQSHASLLELKRRMNRPQDQADLAALTRALNLP